jgi:hypothetical protein
MPVNCSILHPEVENVNSAIAKTVISSYYAICLVWGIIFLITRTEVSTFFFWFIPSSTFVWLFHQIRHLHLLTGDEKWNPQFLCSCISSWWFRVCHAVISWLEVLHDLEIFLLCSLSSWFFSLQGYKVLHFFSSYHMYEKW